MAASLNSHFLVIFLPTERITYVRKGNKRFDGWFLLKESDPPLRARGKHASRDRKAAAALYNCRCRTSNRTTRFSHTRSIENAIGVKVLTDPNEHRRTRQDIAIFGNVLSLLLFFALFTIEIHRRSLRPPASPRSFTTRKKNFFLLLLGIFSGRPFMARTSPFPSLRNSELPVLPEL